MISDVEAVIADLRSRCERSGLTSPISELAVTQAHAVLTQLVERGQELAVWALSHKLGWQGGATGIRLARCASSLSNVTAFHLKLSGHCHGNFVSQQLINYQIFVAFHSISSRCMECLSGKGAL